jgi:hypothetical protein
LTLGTNLDPGSQLRPRKPTSTLGTNFTPRVVIKNLALKILNILFRFDQRTAATAQKNQREALDATDEILLLRNSNKALEARDRFYKAPFQNFTKFYKILQGSVSDENIFLYSFSSPFEDKVPMLCMKNRRPVNSSTEYSSTRTFVDPKSWP